VLFSGKEVNLLFGRFTFCFNGLDKPISVDITVWWLLTFVISSFLTWVDVNSAMPIVPEASPTRKSVRLSICLFIGINGLLSILFYCLFVTNKAFVNWTPIWKASALGLMYPALIRSKFATLTVDEREVPLGLDLYYEKIRKSFYKRIDRLVRDEEYAAVIALAEGNSSDELLQKAKFVIDSALAQSNAEKEERRNWCYKLENDQNASEQQKKMYLASFILYGRTQNL
jgi:hypothetical protein